MLVRMLLIVSAKAKNGGVDRAEAGVFYKQHRSIIVERGVVIDFHDLCGTSTALMLLSKAR